MRLSPSPRRTAPCWWNMLAAWLGLAEPEGLRLWNIVCTARDPKVRAWRLTCAYFHVHPGDRASSTAFLTGPLRPTRVIHVLEALVQERKLTRTEATRMEEHVFPQMTRDGYWT